MHKRPMKLLRKLQRENKFIKENEQSTVVLPWQYLIKVFAWERYQRIYAAMHGVAPIRTIMILVYAPDYHERIGRFLSNPLFGGSFFSLADFDSWAKMGTYHRVVPISELLAVARTGGRLGQFEVEKVPTAQLNKLEGVGKVLQELRSRF